MANVLLEEGNRILRIDGKRFEKYEGLRQWTEYTGKVYSGSFFNEDFGYVIKIFRSLKSKKGNWGPWITDKGTKYGILVELRFRILQIDQMTVNSQNKSLIY
jgi:hypothetical protein